MFVGERGQVHVRPHPDGTSIDVILNDDERTLQTFSSYHALAAHIGRADAQEAQDRLGRPLLP
jgi:hypothetical protein